MNHTKYFAVDVEATRPSPMTGVMTEFGIVDIGTDSYFYGHLWPFSPHPDIPALPVVAEGAAPEPYFLTGSLVDGRRHDGEKSVLGSIGELMAAADDWVRSQSRGGGKSVLVSDNPGFDAMWMTCAFDEAGLSNPFGFSSRRIGDLAAGLVGSWTMTSQWKQLRTVKHTHDPVDDALGNAGALRELLRRYGQEGPAPLT